MKNFHVPGPLARSIVERDSKFISPSYPRGYAFVMDHGQGVEVWDVDGNRYLDFAAGIAVISTGHSHPKVVKAIQEQANKFIHISSDFYHEKWVELAEAINRIAPFSDNAVSFMANSGAESVEAAVKLARYHTGRTQFIGFLGGFHGRTMGAISFTASKKKYRQGFFPWMSGVIHVPYPDPYRPLLQSLPQEDYGETVVRYIEEQILDKIIPPEDLAGIMIEPIQGEGGYIIPAPGFFPALRRLCDETGALLIADEVQSGMGRTGKWWGIENFGVEPDIVCVAKGVASGVPLGIMFAREKIMNWSLGAHGNTYGGNPLACAAALATIELIEEEYLQNAAEVGLYAKEMAEEIFYRHPSVGQVRGIGLMIGIEFVEDRITKKPAEGLRDAIVNTAFEKGLLLLGCGKSTIRIAPPLSVRRDEIKEAYDILDEAVSESEGKLEFIAA